MCNSYSLLQEGTGKDEDKPKDKYTYKGSELSHCYDYNLLDVVRHLSLSQTKQFILMQFLHYGCLYFEKGLFPRALLTISHHDKHKAKSV